MGSCGAAHHFPATARCAGITGILADTVREFSERGGLPVALEGDLANYPLTPNEEIHVLQIVRGAVERAAPLRRHQRAYPVVAAGPGGAYRGKHQRRWLRPQPRGATGHDHYGKTIMGERAAVLGGCLSSAMPGKVVPR